jgi:glycosyltransferase involved in cell wall biosynthesis
LIRPSDLNLAFVVPRYGPGIVGGAETLARGLAERFASAGARITVFTTCAENHFTWENVLPEGEERLGSVSVRRFRTNPRDLDRFNAIQGRIGEGLRTTLDEQIEWLSEGVASDALLDALEREKDRFDAVVLLPYLFGTTFWAARLAPEKAVLAPCLHDEPFARLAVFRFLFEGVRGFWFNAEAEARLADRLYGVGDRPQAIVGLGFDPDPAGDGARFRIRHGLHGDYLLYFGRKEGGKGVPLLIDWFRRARRAGLTDAVLVLAGDGTVEIPPDAGAAIVNLGFLSPEEKRDAAAGALAVCQLSRNESFSIVLMESWLQGRPVIVHADCPVTREHCEASGGGLWAADAAEFGEAAAWLLRNAEGASRMGRAGRAYALERYGWDRVMRDASRVIEGMREHVRA